MRVLKQTATYVHRFSLVLQLSSTHLYRVGLQYQTQPKGVLFLKSVLFFSSSPIKPIVSEETQLHAVGYSCRGIRTMHSKYHAQVLCIRTGLLHDTARRRMFASAIVSPSVRLHLYLPNVGSDRNYAWRDLKCWE